MVGRPCSRNVRKLASTVRKLREMEAGILLASSICPSYSIGNPKPWDGAVCIQGEPSLLIESPLEMPPLLYPKVCFYVMLSPFNLIIYADNSCGYSMTWREGHSDQPPSGIFSEQAVEGGTMPDEPLWGVSTFKYAQDTLTKRSSLPERNDPSGLNGHLSMSSSEFSYVKEEKLF